MHPDTIGLLWDAQRAGRLVQQFVDEQTVDKLSHVDPATASRITDVPKIVGLRNILVHGYATVDSYLVWRIIEDSLPTLLTEVDQLLAKGAE